MKNREKKDKKMNRASVAFERPSEHICNWTVRKREDDGTEKKKIFEEIVAEVFQKVMKNQFTEPKNTENPKQEKHKQNHT